MSFECKFINKPTLYSVYMFIATKHVVAAVCMQLFFLWFNPIISQISTGSHGCFMIYRYSYTCIGPIAWMLKKKNECQKSNIFYITVFQASVHFIQNLYIEIELVGIVTLVSCTHCTLFAVPSFIKLTNSNLTNRGILFSHVQFVGHVYLR